MARRHRSRGEEILAARLRTEASRSRPRFSEGLHARVCRAILQSRPQEPAADRAGGGRQRWPTWAVAAVAAAASLLVAVMVWRGDRLGGLDGPWPSPLPDQAALNAAVPDDASFLPTELDLHSVAGLAAAVPDRIDALVDSAIAAQQWASLDDDAQLAVKMLADRLPFDLASSLSMAEPTASP